MIRFDDAARTLSVGVNDLLGSPAGGAWGAGAALRSLAGLRLHAAVRAEQLAAGCRVELPLDLHLRCEDYDVSVTGRADCVRPGAEGRVRVEEIKSVLVGGAELAALEPEPRHCDQCLFYCLMLAASGADVEGGAVIYVSVTDGTRRAHELVFDRQAVEREMLARLAALVAEHARERTTEAARQTASTALPFPYPKPREGQKTMIGDAEGAAAAGRVMLCSAPTGIGKTAAALYPFLRHALAADGCVFFVTARVSQQELAMQTLARMCPAGAGVIAVQLTSKERTCPKPEEYACTPGACPCLDLFEKRIAESGVLARLAREPVLTGEAITAAALDAGVCPFELALLLARRAAAVVCDFNYVFDPAVSLRLLAEEGAGPRLLVVDEAHNLPGRVAGYYSPELDQRRLERLAAAALDSPLGPIRDAGSVLDEVCRHHRATLASLAEEAGPRGTYVAEVNRRFFEDILVRLEPVLYATFLALAASRRGARSGFDVERGSRGRRAAHPLLEALFDLRSFSQCCALDPTLFATIWERDRLKMLCLNAAPFIRDRTAGFHSALFMSATLAPMDYHARMLGADGKDAVRLDLPSPFPRCNRLIMAVPTVDTTLKGRDQDAARVAALIAETASLRRGNYLAFFPSFAYRDLVVRHFPPASLDIIVQSPAMPTAQVLARLERNRTGTVVLCAVQGGVFAEGVDFPGHLAIGAFIVGPGIPQVSPEQELIRGYFEETDGHGFELAYVNPGVSRSVQAGGRVIRSESDTGFVMLIGKRFGQALYRRKLPPYWQDELVTTEAPVEEVGAFWQRVDGSGAKT